MRLRIHLAEGDAAAVAGVIADLDAKHQKKPTLENSNDRAVARLITGRYSEALTLLRQVEKSYPGKAIVAANLGTALELSGQNEEALGWIRTGVQRDPKEHFGTEWLHVKILEAKIALAKDPKWLEKHSVIGLDFGTGPRPLLPVSMPLDESGRPRTTEAIDLAIFYQLRERTKFVAARDAIVADLYETRANLNYAVGYDWKSGKSRPSDPVASYKTAQRYGIDDASLVLLRLQQFEKDFPGRSWGEPPATTKP
ncbi:MAG TPA: hypothetical protein VFS58_12415 [Steroidobacteraceae bacterium]|nr:hypothetical protein [Steroidobacteraceae bacterium]